MRAFPWLGDDGWPYADEVREVADPESLGDEDLLSWRYPPPHLFDGLDRVELEVLESRFGIHDHPLRSMHQLQTELGLDHAALCAALESALGKLRAQLTA